MRTNELFQTMRFQVSATWAWWFREIRSMVPERIRHWLLPDYRRVVISPCDGGLSASVISPLGSNELGARWREDVSGWEPATAYHDIKTLGETRAVDLEVPSSLALRQDVKLPRVALADLASAVSYGLPTWTPFSADEVWVSAYTEHVDEAHATVGIMYAPKAQLAPLIALATRSNLVPDRLVFEATARWVTTLDTPKMRHLARVRWIDRGLAAMAIVLALTFLSAIALHQSQELDALQVAIRTELDAVKQDERSRKSIEELAARRTLVARKRAAEPSASEILAFLGTRLPPSAALNLIEISGTKGRIEIAGPGSSEAAAALRTAPPFTDLTTEASLPGRPLRIGFKLARDRP